MASRRTFFLAAGVVAAASQSKALANGKVRVAVLGVNGRGKDHIAGFGNVPDAEIVCLCDPDLAVARATAVAFEQRYGRKVAIEQDLRKVFDRKDIDAVSMALKRNYRKPYVVPEAV